jgi:hypothetical protein
MSVSDSLGGSWDSFSDLASAVSEGYGRDGGGKAEDYEGGSGGQTPEKTLGPEQTHNVSGVSITARTAAEALEKFEAGVKSGVYGHQGGGLYGPGAGTPGAAPNMGGGDPKAVIIKLIKDGKIGSEEGYQRLRQLFGGSSEQAWDYMQSFGLTPPSTVKGLPSSAPAGGGISGRPPILGTGNTNPSGIPGGGISGRPAAGAGAGGIGDAFKDIFGNNNRLIGPEGTPFELTQNEDIAKFALERFGDVRNPALRRGIGRQAQFLPELYELMNPQGSTQTFPEFIRSQFGKSPNSGTLQATLNSLITGTPNSRLSESLFNEGSDTMAGGFAPTMTAAALPRLFDVAPHFRASLMDQARRFGESALLRNPQQFATPEDLLREFSRGGFF